MPDNYKIIKLRLIINTFSKILDYYIKTKNFFPFLFKNQKFLKVGKYLINSIYLLLILISLINNSYFRKKIHKRWQKWPIIIVFSFFTTIISNL